MDNITGSFSVDFKSLADTLALDAESCYRFFVDGRTFGRFCEQKMASLMGWTRVDNEMAPYDLIDPIGNAWELRVVTDKIGVRFAPTSMNTMSKGGQSFNKEEFYSRKLDHIIGYVLVLVDTKDSPPQVQDFVYHTVSKEMVVEWMEAGKLGARAQISKPKLLQLLAA